MDSLDWSKQFPVLAISRLLLSSLGMSNELINLLSDEDMQALADGLAEKYTIGFDEEVKFRASLRMAEIRSDRDKSNKPVREDSEA